MNAKYCNIKNCSYCNKLTLCVDLYEKDIDFHQYFCEECDPYGEGAEEQARKDYLQTLS